MLWSYFRQTSWYVNHPLYHSRPIVCSSGDSCHLSFLFDLVSFSFFSCAFAFPCLTLTILISFFPPCLPLFSFFLVRLCLLSLASWWPLPCDHLCFVTTTWQMLPITVRNMPSISPLILKRLKVQISLPRTWLHLCVTPPWMHTATICSCYPTPQHFFGIAL